MMIAIGFNPCFNGTMYKNLEAETCFQLFWLVSILVLMELCIKTVEYYLFHFDLPVFQSLF